LITGYKILQLSIVDEYQNGFEQWPLQITRRPNLFPARYLSAVASGEFRPGKRKQPTVFYNDTPCPYNMAAATSPRGLAASGSLPAT
jgi:hypothetical protein